MRIEVDTTMINPETKDTETFLVKDWGFTGICEPDGSMLRWIAYINGKREYYAGHKWKQDYKSWMDNLINEGWKCPR